MSSKQLSPNADSAQPDGVIVYQIRIEGHLGCEWQDWFGNVTITTVENGETQLTCTVVDQPELYGVLKAIRNLGLPLISVTRLTSP